jgi:small GTP-binding protein
MTVNVLEDQNYQNALQSLRDTLEKLEGCTAQEMEQLQADVDRIHMMTEKLTSGRVEIVVFGEISTGKSALINALVGDVITEVDVRGGWTRDVWKVDWDGAGYCVPGLADSQLVLVDTPGINEVGGADRAESAREAAASADLLLFVTDSDLNDVEYAAVCELVRLHKPIIVVLNKADLYSPSQLQTLRSTLVDDRLAELVPAEQIITTSADPREIEYVIEDAQGGSRNEWRKPKADVAQLKSRILELLEQDGLALLTLNAAMYAADKNDRIAALRVQLRARNANQTIMSYAAVKSLVVALNPVIAADVIGGTIVDATMVAVLARIYGLEMTTAHAKKLVAAILKAAGLVLLGEVVISYSASVLKGVLFGASSLITAVPQGAAAGYGSYIVGKAAKYYFEHGSSWGVEGPKSVVRRILDDTDKKSVLRHLKDEIRAKISTNRHAEAN